MTEENTPPQTRLGGDDAHWQGLLAAQNNIIDGLVAENDKLRKALEPFSELAARFDGVPVSAIMPQQCWFTPHSLREARAALPASKGSKPCTMLESAEIIRKINEDEPVGEWMERCARAASEGSTDE